MLWFSCWCVSYHFFHLALRLRQYCNPLVRVIRRCQLCVDSHMSCHFMPFEQLTNPSCLCSETTFYNGRTCPVAVAAGPRETALRGLVLVHLR